MKPDDLFSAVCTMYDVQAVCTMYKLNVDEFWACLQSWLNVQIPVLRIHADLDPDPGSGHGHLSGSSKAKIHRILILSTNTYDKNGVRTLYSVHI